MIHILSTIRVMSKDAIKCASKILMILNGSLNCSAKADPMTSVGDRPNIKDLPASLEAMSRISGQIHKSTCKTASTD